MIPSADLFSLKDKVVVVTGVLGQLGSAYATALLNAGARVAGLDLPVSSRVFSTSDRSFYVSCDVTKKASLEKALKKITSHWETPHGLVNNAALDSPPNAPATENGPFETYSEKSFQKVMSVNVTGAFLCCQVFGGAMAKKGRGSIVNISSIYGMVSPNQSIYEYKRKKGENFFKPVAYSVSKSSLLNLTRYLATYWAPKGVRVNTLTLAGVFNKQDPQFLKNYLPHVPLGRMAKDTDYNGAVIFLLSNASSYMTGSNLVVDGGWTAW